MAVPIVGIPGTVAGVAIIDPVASPFPTPLTALICTLYGVPLTRAALAGLSPVITKGEAVVPDPRVLQFVPPLVEY